MFNVPKLLLVLVFTATCQSPLYELTQAGAAVPTNDLRFVGLDVNQQSELLAKWPLLNNYTFPIRHNVGSLINDPFQALDCGELGIAQFMVTQLDWHSKVVFCHDTTGADCYYQYNENTLLWENKLGGHSLLLEAGLELQTYYYPFLSDANLSKDQKKTVRTFMSKLGKSGFLNGCLKFLRPLLVDAEFEKRVIYTNSPLRPYGADRCVDLRTIHTRLRTKGDLLLFKDWSSSYFDPSYTDVSFWPSPLGKYYLRSHGYATVPLPGTANFHHFQYVSKLDLGVPIVATSDLQKIIVKCGLTRGGKSIANRLPIAEWAFPKRGLSLPDDYFLKNAKNVQTVNASLKGLNFVIASETDSNNAYDGTRIKNFLGGDPLPTLGKWQHFQNIPQTWVVALSENHNNLARHLDEAGRNRVLGVVKYNYSMTRKKPLPEDDIHKHEIPGLDDLIHRGRGYEDMYFTFLVDCAHRTFVNGFNRIPQRAVNDRIWFFSTLSPLDTFLSSSCAVAVKEIDSIEKSVFHRVVKSMIPEMEDVQPAELGKAMKFRQFATCRPSGPRNRAGAKRGDKREWRWKHLKFRDGNKEVLDLAERWKKLLGSDPFATELVSDDCD